jgi:hypothetical protein
VIHQCTCGFATDDELWFESHQAQHVLKRDHDVSGMTVGELERARRELAANLALARPDSPARVPILARLNAIDTALVARRADRPEQLGPPRPGHIAFG